MFSRMSFKTKLLFLCLALSGVGAMVGAVNYYMSSHVVASYEDVAKTRLPNMRYTYEMWLAYRNMRVQLSNLAIPHVDAEFDNKAIASIEKSREDFEKARKGYLAVEFEVGEQQLYDRMAAAYTKILEFVDKGTALAKAGRAEDRAAIAPIVLKDIAAHSDEFRDSMTQLLNFHQNFAENSVQKAREETSRSTQVSLLIIALGVIGGMGFSFLISSSISKSLLEVASGLTERARSVEQVALQISSASDGLSAATTQQAAALQETTAAIEETSAMISKNAENAKISTEVSEQSQETASRGQGAVSEMLNSIGEISNSNNEIMSQIEDSNREISEIVKVISEIGNKTKVINDIVFQTKLLSFNASVEAARAGEHGKGFAVVAEEVGNLAQMSGNAAKEISEMLDSSIRKVEMIVQNTQSKVGSLVQNGKEKVSAGTETAKRSSEILEQIVANVGRVSSLVSEISVASQEQAKGISEINKAMSELDSVAQQNSSASQQTASSAEDLKAQVVGVREMIARLNEVVSGAGSGPIVSSRPAAPPQDRKVLAFKPKAKAPKAVKKTPPVVSESLPLKKASGGLDVPRGDDSGFDEA